jgi:hypothetical protein
MDGHTNEGQRYIWIYSLTVRTDQQVDEVNVDSTLADKTFSSNFEFKFL